MSRVLKMPLDWHYPRTNTGTFAMFETAPEGVKAPDSRRYAACGDGIVSWVAYWIGQRIRMIEEEAS